jgi:uracil-DNA glycosylase
VGGLGGSYDGFSSWELLVHVGHVAGTWLLGTYNLTVGGACAQVEVPPEGWWLYYISHRDPLVRLWVACHVSDEEDDGTGSDDECAPAPRPPHKPPQTNYN